MVLQHGWRLETSCRKAPGCVVPQSPNCSWGLKAALLTAKRDIKTASVNWSALCHRFNINVSIYNVRSAFIVWTLCVNFTSVISPSRHNECSASIRRASRLFLSFCKSLKYDTRSCEWSPSPKLDLISRISLINSNRICDTAAELCWTSRQITLKLKGSVKAAKGCKVYCMLPRWGHHSGSKLGE